MQTVWVKDHTHILGKFSQSYKKYVLFSLFGFFHFYDSPVDFLDCLTLEDGIGRLSRHFSNKLPIYAAVAKHFLYICL